MRLFVLIAINVSLFRLLLVDAPTVMEARIDATNHGEQDGSEALSDAANFDRLFDFAAQKDGTCGDLFEVDAELKFEATLASSQVVGCLLGCIEFGHGFGGWIIDVWSSNEQHDLTGEALVVNVDGGCIGNDACHSLGINDRHFMKPGMLPFMAHSPCFWRRT